MKVLKLFLIMISLSLIIYSCQKDTFDENILIESNQSTNHLVSRAVTDCGFIPELCSRPWIAVAQHEPFILSPSSDSLVGGDNPLQYFKVIKGDQTFTVYTLDLFVESEDFIVIDESDNLYFLLETQDPYLQSHDKEISLPKAVNIVANLDYSKFRRNELSLSDIQSSIGTKASTTVVNGEIILDISNVGDDDVQALVRYDWCKYVIPSTIRKYKKELMSSYDIINPDYPLDIAIEESVMECTPDLCLDCADVECVLDKLINHPQISGASLVVRDIKINYLRLLLDLTDEQIEWLKNNPSILDDLFDTYDLNFKGTNEISTRSIGCDMSICGTEGAANAHISLLMEEYTISDEEASNLCNFYTNLYAEDKNIYKCIVGNNNIALKYAILHFGEIDSSLHQKILNAACNPSVLDDSDNWSNLDHPHNYSQVEEIENGITIEEIYGSTLTSCSGDLIGQNVDRMNTEDISHENSGDGTGIELANKQPQETNMELFDRMDNLFFATTVLDSDLRAVGDDFITLFGANTINTHIEDNSIINQKASESAKMKNFVKEFGFDLNQWLTATNGNINNIMVTMDINDRPAFNGYFHKFQGLQILVNDTEFTQMYLRNGSYQYDSTTKEWSAWICFDIEDHFGLDRNDALTYQGVNLVGDGFAAWWILQHQRNQVPFHTRILVEAKISGKLF